MKFWLVAFAIAVQSCTPVFAQSEASRGAASDEEHPAKAHSAKAKKKDREEKSDDKTKKDNDKISTTDTDKAVFEKKENEPSTLEEVEEVVGDTSEKVSRTLGAARLHRQDTSWTINANFTPFEMWTLTKYGLTVGYNRDASNTFELEYMRGSLGFGYWGFDLGSIEEERFGVNWRTFGQRNSFNFVTGLYYNTLEVHLGSRALATVTGLQQAHVSLMEFQTVGLHWGIGNRWQTKSGFTWGLDWISVNLPFWVVKQKHPFLDATSDAGYRNDASDALKFFRRIPEIALFKVQIGVSF